MSLVEGTVTATADLAGNVTLGGSDFALAIATALDPGIAPSQILAYKAALGNPTAFADLITKLYAATATKIASLTAYLNANISGGGSFTAGGDLSGTSTSQSVIAWLGEALDPFTMGLPIDGQIPVFVSGSTAWKARSISGDITMSNAGVTVVAKINGTTVSTAGGALTTGAVLRATGVAAADWGAVDLANASAVTGVLASANQASQAIGGDGSGTTAALTVIKWRGKSLDATTMGSPTDAQIPIWVNGSSSWKSLSVSGDITLANTGAVTVVQVNGASIPAAGALATGNIPIVTGVSALSYVDPTQRGDIFPFGDFAEHKISYWGGFAAFGGAISTANYFGFQFTSNGTASNPPIAGSSTATKLGATQRIGRAATTASSLIGLYDAQAVNAGAATYGPWRGNAANRGGFVWRHRFAITSVGNTSVLHAFFGLTDATGTSGTDWTTDTTLAKVGIGFTGTTTAGSALPSANWQMIESDHNTPHLTNLGANFALTLNDFIEIILYCTPNDTKISYIVKNLTTGNSATGVLNTQLPLSTRFLMPWACVGIGTSTSGTNKIEQSLMYQDVFDG